VSSGGLRPKSGCSGEAQKQLYSNLQTRPLRQGATNFQTRKCLQEISRRKKNWSQLPDRRLTPGQTGRLTVRRKLAATATVETNYLLPVTSCNTCCTRFTRRIINVGGVSHNGTSPHSSIHFLITHVLLRVISKSSFTPLTQSLAIFLPRV
jgi:hypothetical protein